MVVLVACDDLASITGSRNIHNHVMFLKPEYKPCSDTPSNFILKLIYVPSICFACQPVSNHILAVIFQNGKEPEVSAKIQEDA